MAYWAGKSGLAPDSLPDEMVNTTPAATARDSEFSNVVPSPPPGPPSDRLMILAPCATE